MKKILSRLLFVAVVVVAVGVGSRAFFTDTETSLGNTFEAGAVDLKIDSECHYFQNGESVACAYPVEDGEPVSFGTWTSTDLTNEKFFMFDDIKPGDYGENTLSLTVVDNDAYACMYIENAKNLENDLIDPEAEANDITPDVGELAQNLHFTAWVDQGNTLGWQGKGQDVGEGDNIWQGPNAEPILFSNISGPATDVIDGKVYPLGVLNGLETNYIGLYWCAGTLSIVGDAITCDGSTMGNESQTDSLTADLRFYVEQTRNNPSFTCPPIEEMVFVKTIDNGGNDSNKETLYNGYQLPNVDYQVNGLCVQFNFHNPTPFLFDFDYRVDDETGTPWALSDTLIGAGPLAAQTYGPVYNAVSLPGGQSQIVDVCGQNTIEVGLRVGAERDWYFDWIKFEAQPL